ncbi:thiamine-phosphate kinase [Gammaproteobacteria bacterium 2W06]|nr:thiamine-phosphate kinase [Gammaproteobacteria bacterium 2W06]
MARASEFDLIGRYLADRGARRRDVVLGVGDDAAILAGDDRPLLMALDTLVEGVHFPADLPAGWVGHRALAVNLSDIAAMGGEPCWALLGLTLPEADEAWVRAFADGLDALARRHAVALVGGDVTRGPLSISVQVAGHANGPVLRRAGAAAGDRVWVSGRPGDAMGGLAVWQDPTQRDRRQWRGLQQAFIAPRPRVALGQALAGIASAAIDVSDGLVADAGHIARSSGVAVALQAAACRPSARLRHWLGDTAARQTLLAGGDDYELCFTAPAAADGAVLQAARASRTPVRCIGAVSAGAGVWLDGEALTADTAGYRHFSD